LPKSRSERAKKGNRDCLRRRINNGRMKRKKKTSELISTLISN